MVQGHFCILLNKMISKIRIFYDIRNLYLQVLGVYEWEGCNPLPPEFWLFPSALPYHPGKRILVSLDGLVKISFVNIFYPFVQRIEPREYYVETPS